MPISPSSSGIKLYTHQLAAVDSLNKKVIQENKTPFAGLLVLPTGGGKTLTAAYWVAKNFLDKGKKVLWIAHRHTLLEQAKETFCEKVAYIDIFGTIPSFSYRLISGIHNKPVHIQPTDSIIFSSKDSLNTEVSWQYLQKNWLQDTDELLLVIDEAHHATARTYRKLIENLQGSVTKFRMLGLTATPFRTADHEKGQLKKIFNDDVVYKIDLRTLITQGILAEPVFEEVHTEIDMKNVFEGNIEELNKRIKLFDFTSIGEKYAESIGKHAKRNKAIVDQYVDNKSKYQKTIIFAINQGNAIALTSLLRKKNIKADYVIASVKDAGTWVTISGQENKRKIEQFRNGELEVLINVNILTEGVDLPDVQTVFLARPTISPVLMTQMIGRALRGEKAGGSKKAYIVSFIDDWKNTICWVNPEQLFIEENVDFNDDAPDTKKSFIQLISIKKLEEFANLADDNISTEEKQTLKALEFIQRIPVGIYYFSLLRKEETAEYPDDDIEKNCEVLVYDSMQQAYEDFIKDLPELLELIPDIKQGLSDKNNEIADSSSDELSPTILSVLSAIAEEKFFDDFIRDPFYRKEDIEDILLYYYQKDEAPPFIPFAERKQYG